MSSTHHTLFVIAYDGDRARYYKTAASPDLLAKVHGARRALGAEPVEVEGSAGECLTVPLGPGKSVEAFLAAVGPAPLTEITEAELLELTKTDGVDMFY